MRHTFQSTHFLPHPVETVFQFFANPDNLPRLMPAWQDARIEEAAIVPPPRRPDGSARAGTIAAGAGTRLTISFRPLPLSPVRVPWEAEIDEFAWNDHFCDSQVRGPFAFWHHCHRIAAATQNGVPGATVTDDLTYELPLGWAGELAHGLFLRAQIARTFAFRQRRTAELLAPRHGQA